MSIVDTISGLAGGAISNALGGATDIAGLSNQIISATALPISLAQDALSSAVGSINTFAALPQTILSEVPSVAGVIDNIVGSSDVSSFIEKALGDASGISTALAGQFSDVLGQVSSGMGDMVSSMQNTLTTGVSEALGGLANLDIAGNFSQITESLAGGLTGAISGALGNINIPGLDVSAITGKIGDALTNVVSSSDILMGAEFGDQLAEQIFDSLDGLPEGVPAAAIAAAAGAAAAAVALNMTQAAPPSDATNAIIHWFTRGVDVPFGLVAAKRAGITTGVKKALSNTWDEPKTAFAPVYPYNKVFMSESNHIFEIDDTPGAERLHWFHRRGNFEEWFPDGKRVIKVVNKNYEVMMNDDHKHVQGHSHLSTEGRHHLFTKGEYYIENIGQSVWVDYTRTTIIAPQIHLNP